MADLTDIIETAVRDIACTEDIDDARKVIVDLARDAALYGVRLMVKGGNTDLVRKSHRSIDASVKRAQGHQAGG